MSGFGELYRGDPEVLLNCCLGAFSMRCKPRLPANKNEGGREGGETPNFFAYLRLLVSIKKSKNLHDSARTYQNKLADYKSSRPFRGGKTF